MYRYIIYHENGRKQALESQKRLKLGMLQKIVGGFIECVQGDLNGKPALFVVDEEGLLKERSRNPHLPQFVGTVIMTTPDGVQ